ncbi:hypothetical protein EV702DRAFT_1154099, partial [Suillus placidus]
MSATRSTWMLFEASLCWINNLHGVIDGPRPSNPAIPRSPSEIGLALRFRNHEHSAWVTALGFYKLLRDPIDIPGCTLFIP